MRKRILMAILACTLPSMTVLADSRTDASEAIHSAVLANNQAAAKGFEWRDTYKKLLGPAKQAYQKGDYQRAIDLANTAKSHAELGLEQAKQASMASAL